MSYMSEHYRISDELIQAILALTDELGILDATHYRAYRPSLRGEEFRQEFRNFLKTEKTGCCCSYEGSVSINGEKWVVGFNYDH